RGRPAEGANGGSQETETQPAGRAHHRPGDPTVDLLRHRLPPGRGQDAGQHTDLPARADHPQVNWTPDRRPVREMARRDVEDRGSQIGASSRSPEGEGRAAERFRLHAPPRCLEPRREGPEDYSGSLVGEKEQEQFGELYNGILKELKKTYPEKGD